MSKLPQYVFTKNAEEIADYVAGVWLGTNEYRSNARQRSLFAKAYQAYYGHAWGTYHGTVKMGEQGEFTGLSINELRRNIKSVVSLTTENKLVFDCVTTSTDVQAQNNVIIGNSLLERKFYKDKLEIKCRQLLEQGLVFGTSYMFVGYKASNDMVGIDGAEKPTYKGSLDARLLSVLDVIEEPSQDQDDAQQYIMFRSLENRYDLAAKYPEVAEEILRLPIPTNLMNVKIGATAEEQANIWVYYTFHDKTRAIPQGLMHVCLDESIVLFSDVNPYECIPVVKYRPHVVYGSSAGHALSYDLMPVQEAMNTLDSAFLTLAENYALPNIVADKQFQATESALAGGMKLITGIANKDAPNGGYPMAMDMPKPDGVYLQLNESYQQRLMSLAGQTEASQGQVQSQQSGTAIALAQSASQTYNSSIEFGYTSAVEKIASLILRVSRLFMTKEEIIEQAGLSLEFQASTYANASLDSINGVIVDTGNALGKTISGRLEIATALLGQGQISPVEYLSILQTGNLPKTVQNKTSGETLISKENEMLITGQAPIMSVLDQHINHINAHKTVLENPNIRASSEIVALVMEHIESHLTMITQLKMENPELLDIALGIPLGTTAMANPQQPPQSGQAPAPQGNPEVSQTADAAIEGGAEPVAASARARADKTLESVGGEAS